MSQAFVYLEYVLQLDGPAAEQGAASRVHIRPGSRPAGGPPGAWLPCPWRHPAESGGQERQPGGGDYPGPGAAEQTWLQDLARPLGQGLLGQWQEVSGQGQDRSCPADPGPSVPAAADIPPEVRGLRASDHHLGRLWPSGGHQGLYGSCSNTVGQPGHVPHCDWLVQTVWDLLTGQRPSWRRQGGQAGCPGKPLGSPDL